MTSASFSRRLALLAALASSVWLASCGSSGSSGGGQGNIRALNLTGDLASIDLYIGGTKQFSALNTGTLANYTAVDANTYAINVNSAGNSTALFTGSYGLAKDAHYTAVVWGPQASLHVSTLPEDEDAANIASGNTRVRMFNATTETGAVDVYLTSGVDDLSASTPTQASLASGSLAGFKEIPAGTYRLRVTGVGNPNDIRLDIASVTLAASKFGTLMLTAGTGGVLVNGTLIVQQGSAAALTNTKARARVVSSVDASGIVAANVGGVVLAGGLQSPAVGQYTLVDAGNTGVTVRINGNTVLSGPLAFAPGADYTLLTYGSAALGQVKLISDDNRLPVSNTRTKVRLINGVGSLDPLTLLVDYGAVSSSSNVVAGTASAYTQIASNTGAQIEVDSPTLGPVYLTTRTNGDVLAGQGVYTVFILSGKDKPTGTLRNERP